MPGIPVHISPGIHRFPTDIIATNIPAPIKYKQPLSYYLNLFTSQYKTRPNFMAWEAVQFQLLDDLTTAIAQFNDSYNLLTAIGKQLDFLGEILGQSRTVSFQPSMGVSPVLDDATYRTLLYATQAKNNWDGKTSSLYSIWKNIFPLGTIVIHDNQDMTATILVSGSFSSIERDLIFNGFIVPRPEGVLYNYLAPTLPLFGFDLNTADVAGFDLGHFE